MPHSGQPELLTTLQGPVLHIATSGIHWTSDAGQTWNKLNVPGTAYYPRSVQAKDGRIFVFGHVGGDDAYGKVDQSIVMDSFRLNRRNVGAAWTTHDPNLYLFVDDHWIAKQEGLTRIHNQARPLAESLGSAVCRSGGPRTHADLRGLPGPYRDDPRKSIPYSYY